MPTNLPPEYFAAERRYREAETTADKVACLEELIATIPKHKGTDHLRADLRRKLSKLKSQAQTRKSTGKRDSVFNVKKEGAGQVAVVGPTNVGKSALVARLTNATPEVAEAPFTTWQPTPGMMLVEGVPVQLVDTPPLDRDFVEPALMALIRRADLVLLVVDLQADPVQQLEDTVALLAEYRIVPCHRRGQYPEEERLTFIPFLVLVNKSDDEGADEDVAICSPPRR
jgi:ribosome-interacting GTPase 1